jgi:hypothetical protein
LTGATPVTTEGVAMTQPAPVPTPPPGDPAPAPIEPAPSPAPTPPPADTSDRPLGPAGEKALATERAERKKLEQQLAALSPLQKLAEAMGAGTPAAGGKTEVELLNERFASLERTANEERAARFRVEVAQAKNLTAEQSAWLQGSSREELESSADRLLAAFPAAPAGPRNPVPDPSQGTRGGQPGPDHAAKVAELKAKGDVWGAIALERSKLQTIERPK